MNNIKGKIKAIIFDMDGTIIDTQHVWEKVTFDLLAKQGVTSLSEKDHAFLNSLAGMNLLKASAAVKEVFKLQDSVDEIFMQKLLLANERFLSSSVDFMPGFKEFQKRLQAAGIPHGIATNAHPTNLVEVVRVMELEKMFGTHIYSIEHVGVPKPDPALFLHTAKMLGVKPEECVVFEDSIHGFKAAQAAGIKCIAFKNANNQNLLDLVHDAISHYDQAEEVLKKLK